MSLAPDRGAHRDHLADNGFGWMPPVTDRRADVVDTETTGHRCPTPRSGRDSRTAGVGSRQVLRSFGRTRPGP
ncbi:hypothetical protein TOK_0756 [Pseudonocardia sp. N23]|nr:hypothetical protein TOK_0756 [Pseudonocardia sp. N23]